MRRKRTRREAAVAERIAVDFPAEGEEVAASRCVFLIDAPERGVEISIDGDDWRRCRRGDDYWRYDWTAAEPGRHAAVVRCARPESGEAAIRVCHFLVGGVDAAPGSVAKA
jgi:hypothetical protein